MGLEEARKDIWPRKVEKTTREVEIPLKISPYWRLVRKSTIYEEKEHREDGSVDIARSEDKVEYVIDALGFTAKIVTDGPGWEALKTGMAELDKRALEPQEDR